MSDAPSRAAALAFLGKASALRVRRAVRDLRRPVPRHGRGDPAGPNAAEVRVPLYEGREPEMELGKAQNLRLVAARLDGLRVPAGETLSFWRQVGRCTRRRGFVRGREIRQGCVVPSVGGGICAVTNALYEAALAAGLEVVERHAHSLVLPGSAAERGLDATVAWNYLDLRLRAPFAWSLRVELNRDEVVVAVHADAQGRKATRPRRPLNVVGDCATCERQGCFRHASRPRLVRARTAWWVDEAWPEFAAYAAERGEDDLLFAPMKGRAAYDWPGADAAATLLVLRHALLMRRLAHQGALRQAAALARAEALAHRYARLTPYDADEIVLPISLLPFAWRSGALGGRRFRVLATRLPLAEIHRRLDAALDRRPERALLGDFRAPAALVEAEREALREADSVVAPHPEIAALFGARAVRLPWAAPSPAAWTPGPAIGFPGPVVGRKGAHEVREAARRMNLAVVTPGRSLEGDGFWEGVEVRRGSPLEGTFAVVQPALVEDRPRALLRARAAACPTVATRACGVEATVEVPPLDVEALVAALEALRPSASS